MSTEVKKVKLKIECPVIDEKYLTFQPTDNFVEQGAYGKVCKATYEGNPVAVKYFKSAEEKRGYKQELVFLKCLQKHDNIVILYGTGSSLKTKEPYIVMEFAPYSLERVLHHSYPRHVYGADHVMHWSRQAAIGLKYIHSKRILHRDIKSSNLLLFGNGCHLKLCDFGTCRNLETNLLYTASIGTVRYMAPEVIQGESYTTMCDIFSFAITLWEMVARKVPTIDSVNANSYAILYQMVQGKRPPIIINVPRFINELLTRCWHQDPAMRLSSVELEKKFTNVCKYFPFGRPLSLEEKEEEEDSEEEDEEVSSEGEEEEKPITAIIKDPTPPTSTEYVEAPHPISRTRSDMTLANTKSNTPVSTPVAISLQNNQIMTSQKSEPFEMDREDHFHHGYPPRDHYTGPKRSVSPLPPSHTTSHEPFSREEQGRVAVVHHEFHEMIDPHLRETQYTSLDENRLRFDIQCQYQQIEQAYLPTSLPSHNRLGANTRNRISAPAVPRIQRNNPNNTSHIQPVRPVETDPESLRMYEQFQKLSGRLAKKS